MNFLHYLLQVNLYLVVFYGFYRLWLRDETFHHLNRLYLVASATLSFFIPVLHSDWVRGWFLTQEVSETIYTYYNPQAIIIVLCKPKRLPLRGGIYAPWYISVELCFL